MFGSSVPAGYCRFEVLYGFWDGTTWPANSYVVVGLVPEEFPESVMTFLNATDHGVAFHLFAQHIESFDVKSGGWTFLGVGPTNSVAAGIATEVDRHLAPWELHVQGPGGEFRLRGEGGFQCPLPGRGTWARVEGALAQHRYQVANGQPAPHRAEFEADQRFAMYPLASTTGVAGPVAAGPVASGNPGCVGLVLLGVALLLAAVCGAVI